MNGKREKEKRKRGIAWARSQRLILAFCLLPFALSHCGCAGFWDEMTRRDRTIADKTKSLFVKKDPWIVARNKNADGDDRAKALRALKEPKQHGGSDKDQDRIVEILAEAATTARQPVCRLAAIQTLGTFKDPRAFQAVETAFYNAEAFPPEIRTRLQCQALTAMGETGNPLAVSFLTKQLKEPYADRFDRALAQQRADRCTTAARALGHFNDFESREALLEVLHRNKEDVALRNEATASLQTITGKNLPADPQAWEALLHPKDGKYLAKEKSGILKLVGWFW